MAVVKYGYNVGNFDWQVTATTGSAITEGVEINMDLSKVLSQKDAIIALEQVSAYILSNPWPAI